MRAIERTKIFCIKTDFSEYVVAEFVAPAIFGGTERDADKWFESNCEKVEFIGCCFYQKTTEEVCENGE